MSFALSGVGRGEHLVPLPSHFSPYITVVGVCSPWICAEGGVAGSGPCYRMSARLSRTRLLAFVRALKAAEL